MIPILWVGPAASGKLTAARAYFGCDLSDGRAPRLRTLEIADYAARYWEFPTHLEIDITDLSMMDKKILPEMLQQLLGSSDVLTGIKRMIIRRIHSLSPAAAIQLRVCLEEFVWSATPTAVVQCTARTVNAVVAGIMDGFVYRRCPLMRATDKPTPSPQTYVEEMVQQMIVARPSLAAIEWLRARTYDLLGMMVSGGDLITWLTFAIVRQESVGALSYEKMLDSLRALSTIRWQPSYRIPLMIEFILVTAFDKLSL